LLHSELGGEEWSESLPGERYPGACILR